MTVEPQSSRDERFDLIVLGGGPGGATLGTLVAMQGHKVLLLERERFPRHKIGESLLPSTIHGILPLLGLKEEIEQAGFIRKRGGTFVWGSSPDPWTFAFSENPKSPVGFAYQVERAKFDQILLNNARRKGVDVREEHALVELLEEDGRVVGVKYTDDNGQEHTATARFVACADGNRSQAYQKVGKRIYSDFFQNIAIYGYFENGKRLPAPNGGNILCAAFEDGWFWYIPLTDTLTSVGAVVAREKADRLQQDRDSAFQSFVDVCPVVKDLLTTATRVSEGPYGSYRVVKDYSYTNTKFWKPGMVLIGDAACFIDPVFSSGVHLATYSGLLAARSINTLLRGGLDETACFNEFELRYRHEYSNFFEFLLAFYDMHQSKESYFWAARKVLNTTESANEAFVRLVAGLSSTELSEAENNGSAPTASEFFKSREGLGEWLHGMLADESEGMTDVSDDIRDIDKDMFEPRGFVRGSTSKMAQLQLLARLRELRPEEVPAFADGLIPSRDGFHWEAAR